MEIYLTNLHNGLKPINSIEAEKLARFKLGAEIKVKASAPRNGKFHSKFFALLGYVFDNQDKYKNAEDLLVEFKVRTGHYQEHITSDGKMVYVPKSISFTNMDEYEFGLFYQKSIQAALDLLPDSYDENTLNGVLMYV